MKTSRASRIMLRIVYAHTRGPRYSGARLSSRRAKRLRPRFDVMQLAAEQAEEQRPDASRDGGAGIALPAHRRLQLATKPAFHLIQVRERQDLDVERRSVVVAVAAMF